MNEKVLINQLPSGAIIWKNATILGIKGRTLAKGYEKFEAVRLPDNDFDYEIVFDGTLKELREQMQCAAERKQ